MGVVVDRLVEHLAVATVTTLLANHLQPLYGGLSNPARFAFYRPTLGGPELETRIPS